MRSPVHIYHITHIDNLEGILQEGGLWAKNSLKSPHVSVAYEHIQIRRSMKNVPVYPGGTLHDYVPFYFCPRSPMLYVLHNPPEDQMPYKGGQRPILHLVANLDAVREARLEFVFTDRHALTAYARFYTSKDDPANCLDWKAIGSDYWYNTPEQPDRREKKQAEFLVHRFFPWELIEAIGVMNQDIEQKVLNVLQRFPSHAHPPVWVRRGWYY